MQQANRYNRTRMARYRSQKAGRRRRRLVFTGAFFTLVLLTAALVNTLRQQAPADASAGNGDSSVAQNDAGLLVASGPEEGGAAQISSSATASEITGTEEGALPEEGYDYSNPVPESEAVDNSYFDDAVFIGDSRTEGFIVYTGLSNAIAYTHQGLMVDTVFTKPVINMNGEKVSVMDALRQTQFGKVYIMLGINEAGWPYSDVFIEKYGAVIDEIKAINPEALIYIQEILPVTDAVSQTHSYVKNEKINEYNTLIRQMAEEKQVYYIDAGKAVADENGVLPEEAASDGIHLKQAYCEEWLEYLKTHTVNVAES